MEKRDEEIENVAVDADVSTGGVAKTANRAVRDTAQKYLHMAGVKVDLENIEARLRERALISLAIAAGTGFVLGGGLATKPGVILLGLFGRVAARQTATNVGSQILQNTGSRVFRTAQQ